jgi:hypothetical protein
MEDVAMTHPDSIPNASGEAAPEYDETIWEHVARGTRAFLGIVIAILGVMAAGNPDSPVLKALHQAMPLIAGEIPTMITTFGAVLAALSQPPKLRRRRAAAS